MSLCKWLLKAALKKKIEAVDPKVNYTEVFEAIGRIKAVKLTSGKQEIIFRTEFEDKAHVAFKALGMAPPPRTLFYNKARSVVSRPQASDLLSSTK